MIAELIQSTWEWVAHSATAPIRVFEHGSNAHMNDWITLVVAFMVVLALGVTVNRR
jgi:hypothetical protein